MIEKSKNEVFEQFASRKHENVYKGKFYRTAVSEFQDFVFMRNKRFLEDFYQHDFREIWKTEYTLES